MSIMAFSFGVAFLYVLIGYTIASVIVDDDRFGDEWVMVFIFWPVALLIVIIARLFRLCFDLGDLVTNFVTNLFNRKE